MLIMRIALFVGFAFATSLASAEARAGSARCEGCTESQFRSKAVSLGVGQHIITSFSTNQIKLYSVTDISGGEPNVPVRWVASQQAVPADIQGLYNDIRTFYVQTNGTMRAAVEVRAVDLGMPRVTTGTTAFDVVRDVNLRGQIGDRLGRGNLPGVANLDRIGELLVQGIFGFFGAGDASIEVTVRFDDGSISVYRLSNGSYQGDYQEGRGRTSEGQVIPEENSRAYEGTWTGANEVPKIVEHLKGLGANIVYQGTGTTQYSASCSYNGITGGLLCVVQRRRPY